MNGQRGILNTHRSDSQGTYIPAYYTGNRTTFSTHSPEKRGFSNVRSLQSYRSSSPSIRGRPPKTAARNQQTGQPDRLHSGYLAFPDCNRSRQVAQYTIYWTGLSNCVRSPWACIDPSPKRTAAEKEDKINITIGLLEPKTKIRTPCSWSNPSKDEHPGPPFVQRINESSVPVGPGGKNQKNSYEPASASTHQAGSSDKTRYLSGLVRVTANRQQAGPARSHVPVDVWDRCAIDIKRYPEINTALFTHVPPCRDSPEAAGFEKVIFFTAGSSLTSIPPSEDSKSLFLLNLSAAWRWRVLMYFLSECLAETGGTTG